MALIKIQITYQLATATAHSLSLRAQFWFIISKWDSCSLLQWLVCCSLGYVQFIEYRSLAHSYLRILCEKTTKIDIFPFFQRNLFCSPSRNCGLKFKLITISRKNLRAIFVFTINFSIIIGPKFGEPTPQGGAGALLWDRTDFL